MIIPKSPLDSKSVAMHYNELDSFYRQIWGNHLHHGLWHTGSETTQEAVKNLIRFVAGLAELKPEMSLCDVGCGYGETARMLADENNIHVTA